MCVLILRVRKEPAILGVLTNGTEMYMHHEEPMSTHAVGARILAICSKQIIPMPTFSKCDFTSDIRRLVQAVSHRTVALIRDISRVFQVRDM